LRTLSKLKHLGIFYSGELETDLEWLPENLETISCAESGEFFEKLKKFTNSGFVYSYKRWKEANASLVAQVAKIEIKNV
jgi:hypothetical protein